MQLQRLIPRTACAIALVIIALALWRLWASLAINSFWQDELFSMNLARMPAFGPMLTLAAWDTHPPTFYALLWGWTHLFGLGEVVSRLLPALCSVGLIVALVLLPRRDIALLPRLFVAMMVVTSRFWFEHAGEVRSYALAALLLALAALASSRLVAELSAQRLPRWRAVFFLATTFAAATHLFALYASAWLCLALFAIRPDHWRTALAALAGTALAGGAYLAQVLLFHDFGSSGLLFDPQPGFLRTHVLIGLRSAGLPMLLGPTLLAACAAIVLALRRGFADAEDRQTLLHDAALLAGPIMVVLAGLFVTLIVPSLNYRGPQVGLVLGWCGLIGLMDRALRAFPRVGQVIALAAVVLTAAWLLTWQGLRPLPARADFRGLADFLASHSGCRGAVIPVLRDVPAADKIDLATGEGVRVMLQERFGYYDPQAGHRFIAFPLVAGRYADAFAPRALIAARIKGSDPCPVLAVTADVRGQSPAKLEAALRDAIAANGGNPARLEARWFVWYADARPDQPIRQLAAFTLEQP